MLRMPSRHLPRTAVFVVMLATPLIGGAQDHPEYVALGRLNAAVYRPATEPAPHVGFLVMHRTANYLNHIGCTELSKRGFLVLCMNSRFQNNESQVRTEEIPLDLKIGVEFLRRQPGITRVVLLGHSGGGPIMGLYQAVAEQGAVYCKGANKLVPCGDELNGLPRADAIVFADAHQGNPVQILRAMNPSVIADGGTLSVIRELDPFDSQNGFNPSGQAHYSQEFQDRYYKAQAQRMSERVRAALVVLERMSHGDYSFPDDDILIIPAGGNPGAGPGGDATLAGLDSGLELMSTVKPRKLLRNDGSIVTQVVKSVAVADPQVARTNRAFETGTRIFTIKSFLSANAVRATDARYGIDHCSTNNSTTCAVQSITVPILVTTMGAYRFIRDGEEIFEQSASRDKDYVAIEGALHGFSPCTTCERLPGQYSEHRAEPLRLHPELD